MDEFPDFGPPPAKRGRKPLGQRAMTSAEAKRRSRSQKEVEGFTAFSVQLRGSTRDFIRKLAAASGSTQAKAVELLLDYAIAKVGLAVASANVALDKGDSPEAIAAAMAKELSTAPTQETLSTYKEVMNRA